MPSILIEAGFMTNKKEGDYLNSKKGQAEISNSIYKAIKKYKKAIRAYKILCLKYPEKNVLFASQIEKIKNLQLQ